MAKSPDFTTNKIKQNAPQLTYATPKGMPAEFNSLTSTLETVDAGIKTAVELDKMNVVQTSEERAQNLADAYLAQSPSEINYFAQQKQTAIEGLSTDPDNPMWQTMLDEANNKLVNVYKQGQISAYEFKKRSQIEAEKILANNPAYADEILTSMQKVYERTGLTDTLTVDTNMLKNTKESNDKMIEGMIKDLKGEGIFVRGKSDEEIIKTYADYSDKINTITAFKLDIENFYGMDKDEILKRQGQITEMGGPYAMLNMGLNLYKREQDRIINKVEDYADFTLEQQRDALEKEKVVQQNTLNKLIQIVGNAKFPNLFTVNNNAIKNYHESALKRLSGEEAVTDLEMDIREDKALNTLKIRSVINPEEMEYARIGAGIMEKIKNAAPNYPFNPVEVDEIYSSFVNNIFIKDKNNMDTQEDDLSRYEEIFKNVSFLNEGVNVGKAASKSLTKYGIIGSVQKGHLTNLWNATEVYGTSPKRMEVTDRLIRVINQLPANVNTEMIKTSASYNSSYIKEEGNYATIINNTIKVAKEKDPIPSEVNINSNLGVISFSNRSYNDVANRINAYLIFKAKRLGVKPGEIIDETLKTDFPMLFSKEQDDNVPEKNTPSNNLNETIDSQIITFEDLTD